MRAANYSVLELELAGLCQAGLDTSVLESHEASRTGWLAFLEPFSSSPTGQSWNNDLRTPVNHAGLVWMAESGTWPASFDLTLLGKNIALESLSMGGGDPYRFVAADLNVGPWAPLVVSSASVVSYEVSP